MSLSDDIRLFLPKYLSPERQADLWDDLRHFPSARPLYTERAREHDLLQGDGWQGFIRIDFSSGERKAVAGIILSNSCDISADNRRVLASAITFAPLMKLHRYLSMLEAAGQSADQVRSVAETMRLQKVTSMMYFPAIAGVMEESIALLGDTHSHPTEHFRRERHGMLFRLSDFGFYLLLFKLSIHFSRMLEGVER